MPQLRSELGDVAQPAAQLGSIDDLEGETVVAGLQVMRESSDTELARTRLQPARLFAELVHLRRGPRPRSAQDPAPSDQKRQRIAHQCSRIRGWLADRNLPIDRLRHQTSSLSQRSAEDTCAETEDGQLLGPTRAPSPRGTAKTGGRRGPAQQVEADERPAERRISSNAPRCRQARSIPRGFWPGTADDTLRRNRIPERAGSRS